MKRYGPSGEALDVPPPSAQRSYSMALGGRLTTGWRSNQSSADQELHGALATMRGRSRELIRNGGYAKRARVIVVNNVIGPGMGMQARVRNNRDRLIELNDAIETAWDQWSRASSCHTGGTLHFADLERAAMAQVFDAGEVFIRKHYRSFGGSRIPFALELIEPERLADDSMNPSPMVANNDVRMGIELDGFCRPIAYWIRNNYPGDYWTNRLEPDRLDRVPADQMVHLYVVDRWPQMRGEPWLHTAARRLNDMDGYAEAEIVAARAAACYMAFRKTPTDVPIEPDIQTGAERQIQMDPGTIEQLPAGEDIVFANPNRPNPGMDPFMRMMLREVAAGIGVSYESLSRDYSQSNYSSSRLALLDDRDLWRQLQQWWIRSFREPLHREWLQQAVYSGAVAGLDLGTYAGNVEKYSAVVFKPRGWSWVDPTKEVEAAKIAVRSGMDTLTHVIAQSGDGRDMWDVAKERQEEMAILKEAGVETDTDVVMPDPTATTQAAAGKAEANVAQPAQPMQPSTPKLQVIG